MASPGLETDAVCDARKKREGPQRLRYENTIGDARMTAPTRYSSRAPDLGRGIDSFVDICLSCNDDPTEPVPHDCQQALTALDDLSDEVKNAP